jgi:DNA helicase-2/ATP-dependent DNA helicase PcrA
MEEESRRLKQVLAHVAEQERELSRIPRYHGKELVEQALDRQRQNQLRNLRIALEEPYFGRLDFQPEGSDESVSLYIGKVGVSDARTHEVMVVDWRAPVASMFYSFTGQGETASYESPEGEVEGIVHLKRNIAIRRREIQRLVDSYVRSGDNLGVADEFLLYRLSENKDNRLRDIVSTIQHEQDRIIRAEKNRPLVIQGVPGSGKTTVALHRLAYLLYRYQDKMDPERIVIFAPNRMFIDYISDVLPELGVGDVQQATFEEWAQEVLGETFLPQGREEMTARRFRLAGKDPDVKEDPARIKGSLRFCRFLDAALDELEKQFVPAIDFTAWEGKWLNGETVRDWFYREYGHLPLMKRKERVLARIRRWIEMEHREIRDFDPRGNLKKQAMQQMKAYVKAWPKGGVLDVYKTLLRSPLASELGLKEAAKTFLRRLRQKRVDEEDLAPLVWIHIRLHGVESRQRFDHIVIDEAQDFSPFQLAVLKEFSRGNSFTILGDLLQNIFAFKGIRGWQECLQVFREGEAEYYQLRKSYRSTMEIIRFANAVIEKYAGEIGLPEPVFRSGDTVRVIDASGKWRDALFSSVLKAEKGGSHTIAVVTRTEEEAEEAHQALQNAGISAYLITPGQKEYHGGLSVIPIHLAKGMEFDAVILLHVDEEHYPDHEQSAKLLFVGCTRALHRLVLIHGGQPSLLIPAADGELYVAERV